LILIEQKKRKRKFCFKLKFVAVAQIITTLWQTDTQHCNKNVMQRIYNDILNLLYHACCCFTLSDVLASVSMFSIVALTVVMVTVMLIIFMVGVIMLSFTMPSVIVWIVIMLSVIMLIVIKLTVIMLTMRVSLCLVSLA
jgi:hypothetical protein